MNLISCDNCGVVIDRDKLDFPPNIYNDYGDIDDYKAVWTGNEYVASVPCPVCKMPIPER